VNHLPIVRLAARRQCIARSCAPHCTALAPPAAWFLALHARVDSLSGRSGWFPKTCQPHNQGFLAIIANHINLEKLRAKADLRNVRSFHFTRVILVAAILDKAVTLQVRARVMA